MEQIVIQVRDKEKVKILFKLLTALGFVESVKTSETSETEEIQTDTATQNDSLDFFSLAGLWQDRDVTLESIRQKAWPRRYP